MKHEQCRNRFSPVDVAFLVNALGKTRGDRQSAFKLFTDESCRDLMLDSGDLLGAVIDDEVALLRVSPRLYFYVIVRSLLLDYGVDNRDVADYVAEVLARYAKQNLVATYVVDLVERENKATGEAERFLKTVEKADCLLVLTGMFPEFIEWRKQRRGAPGIEFYEEQGAQTYCTLSKHRMVEGRLSESLETIGDDFHRVRCSLNCIMS